MEKEYIGCDVRCIIDTDKWGEQACFDCPGKSLKEVEMASNVLTCVYCGAAYPEGTPPHGSKVLTDHIKICEKHPMRKLEEDNAKLRKALIGLIGVESIEELKTMETAIRLMNVPDMDKMVSINAIQILIETAKSE